MSSALQEAVVECVPNFSEGRDADVVREVVRAMRVEGVCLLDWSMDASHNRSVVTVAGPPDAVAESAVRGVGRAADLIDLTAQNGVHPRVGAADVVPFVPVTGYTLGQCASLAHHAGVEIWRRFGVPVYFYEAAARRPDRIRLEDVRRGQFEQLRDAVRTDPMRCPDVGECELHRTAGAALLGARDVLVAYNVYLGNADLRLARAVAKQVRASSGGLRGIKAMGVLVDGRAQVSINVTDTRHVPVSEVHAAVERLMTAASATIEQGELIGLVPAALALETDGETLQPWARQIPGFCVDDRVLERRLRRPIAWP